MHGGIAEKRVVAYSGFDVQRFLQMRVAKLHGV
jgi:hypothetical protein